MKNCEVTTFSCEKVVTLAELDKSVILLYNQTYRVYIIEKDKKPYGKIDKGIDIKVRGSYPFTECILYKSGYTLRRLKHAVSAQT